VIGEVNDVYVKVAKIKGDEVPWYNHINEDELFYIISGTLLMEIEGEYSFEMNTGDIYHY
jgi:mannose-6-phosphate isomerase-like protein (cupin superfamily)